MIVLWELLEEGNGEVPPVRDSIACQIVMMVNRHVFGTNRLVCDDLASTEADSSRFVDP